MANQDPLGRSRYFHHASAFGIAAQIDRPIQQTIPTQAAVSLAPSGGHGSHRVGKFEIPGVLSFSSAYVEVGGSFDEVHQTHTTFASSEIEDFNISGVVRADRIVLRLTVYYSATPKKDNSTATPESGDPPQPSFSISGSHFENLRIGGHAINVKLAGQDLSKYDTYSKVDEGYRSNGITDWLIGSGIQKQLAAYGAEKRQGMSVLEHNQAVLNDIATRFDKWKTTTNQADRAFWCSAVRHADLQEFTKNSDLLNFGGIICVPRFGVVSLGELRVHRSHRHFTMIRVQMRSPGSGNIDGGSGSGGGTTIPPG